MDRLNYINKLVKSKYKISLYNSNPNHSHSHSHKQRQKQIKENTIIELYNICSNSNPIKKSKAQSPKSKIK